MDPVVIILGVLLISSLLLDLIMLNRVLSAVRDATPNELRELRELLKAQHTEHYEREVAMLDRVLDGYSGAQVRAHELAMAQTEAFARASQNVPNDERAEQARAMANAFGMPGAVDGTDTGMPDSL